ncbi:hypothetical protein [Mycoplasmopsis alligatoris]|uniref:Lipoprotein n=1 Tax=Mycoplasmopsis alligatoris A21JP2 TaxID=747682 RepID=D4XUY4_9BACT|nr:hypothetical protein [Mycoplasmopsis alligatoris]EFF41829.1 hypothetical protein MALL_0141 [Mycoplasmopsis alligatoris A21JP2]
MAKKKIKILLTTSLVLGTSAFFSTSCASYRTEYGAQTEELNFVRTFYGINPFFNSVNDANRVLASEVKEDEIEYENIQRGYYVETLSIIPNDELGEVEVYFKVVHNSLEKKDAKVLSGFRREVVDTKRIEEAVSNVRLDYNSSVIAANEFIENTLNADVSYNLIKNNIIDNIRENNKKIEALKNQTDPSLLFEAYKKGTIEVDKTLKESRINIVMF